MHCPLHEDENRSARLNIKTGVWHCFKSCGGGRVKELIDLRDQWVDPAIASANGHAAVKPVSSGSEKVTDNKIAGWMQALQDNDAVRNEFIEKRGLTNNTILKYEIGWDAKLKAYTIPIRSATGKIWNVRRYQLHPARDRRKVWSVKGMGQPRLYPISILDDDPEYLIVCEGELDALFAIQEGFAAITRTGAAKVWHSEWNHHFEERNIYLCHDMDEAGQDGNRKVGRALRHAARDVRLLPLPYAVTKKHGKDLTDFLLDKGRKGLKELLRNAPPFDPKRADPTTIDPADATVVDTFDSRRVGEPVRVTVTVKGRREPGYSVPRRAKLTCTRDADPKRCAICPMFDKGGTTDTEVHAFDPIVLEMIGSTKSQVLDILRKKVGALKCPKLKIDVSEQQAVEQLYARPSIQHSSGRGDYKNIKLTSVGRHDTPTNITIQAVGALQPEPRTQLNEFQVWEVAPMSDGLDNWELDSKMLERLKRFQPRRGQRPLKKLGEISRELSNHVTHIYGRPEMHAAMDLVWHSALEFDFDGKRMKRGWLDLLIVGDTRTGKSEAAERLAAHYNAGEIVSCESATFAGVIGGLQQYGSNKEWSITWGMVPLNDRRLVVLDEVGGLSTEEIARLSDIRSRGVAQLTKIQQEATHARTRLIWMGNPRDNRMSSFTWGVQAIKPLIGNNEDIARFDLAMSVVAGDVPSDVINRGHKSGKNEYPTTVCGALIRWVWSRKPEQIVWDEGVEKRIYELSLDLGAKYVEDPPLIQSANVREKIARLSVALAARLFSTEDGENLIVRVEHVEDAVAFVDHIYHMRAFGYAELSKEFIEAKTEAHHNIGQIRKYIQRHVGLATFLRNSGHFRRQDLEEILNITREEANSIINTLWDARMVRKEQANVKIEDTLHKLLREIK